MLLWNAILPDIFTAKPISFWQALGLLALARILFGGFRGPWGGGGNPGRYRGNGPGGAWREKWKNMSAEERVKFRSEWRKRCGREN